LRARFGAQLFGITAVDLISAAGGRDTGEFKERQDFFKVEVTVSVQRNSFDEHAS
jgi:hypothetical protein